MNTTTHYLDGVVHGADELGDAGRHVGLYLGGAGCHGGPGITFIPGYNAGYQVLADAGR